MIFEYPEDFIVPIVVDEDLMQERNETENERDILTIGNNWHVTKMDLENMNGKEKNKYKEYGHNKYDITNENDDNGHTKTILNDIDEEYAISETSAI
ncbi:hypothetical protein [Clostridium sp. C2-6-12]|uniref:hypothetical protein n=1 Tax=Clostridium sp. C2-6-12 TaxID=2698832 RepID=UPI00136B1433|nr:hypothetical protein [Clostridium sp. C2-6-12]